MQLTVDVRSSVVLLFVAFICLAIPSTVSAQGAVKTPAPRVWIFMGHPGDDGRVQRYLDTVNQLQEALPAFPGIDRGSIRVSFGRRGDSKHPPCDAKRLFRELDEVAKRSRGNQTPVWIFFLGHSNTVPGSANFNLPGRDVTVQEIGERLSHIERRTPIVLWLTTAASGNWVKPLAARHRCIVAASTPGAEDNETVFPEALAAVLTEPRENDTNGDGMLSVAEIVAATSARVAHEYHDRKLLRTEHAVVETNADGEPSSDPASPDMHGARRFALRIQ